MKYKGDNVMYSFSNKSTLYVSQTVGDDCANGFAPVSDGINGPLKTLECAITLIREAREKGNLRPITVMLTDDYYLSSPLHIDVDAVTLESYGEKKRIIGGIKIDNWKKDVFNGVKCMSARLPDGKWDFTDLWVNGIRAKTTRYPKEGDLKALDTETNSGKELFESSKWFVADTGDLNGIDGIEDAIVNFYHYWIDEHTPIESYDRNTGKLTMKYASRFLITTNEKHTSCLRYYLTNVPSTFSEPNEWYLDRKSSTVYYIGEDIESAFVPTVDSFISICANDVLVRDIEFHCSRGEYVSNTVQKDGKWVRSDSDAYASDIQSVCWAPGAISFEDSVGCSIENCYLHGVGIHAVEIKTGCKNIRIENNKIEDVGAGGIKVFGGEYGCDNSLKITDCIIRGNEIAYCGRRYAAGCGMLINHASGFEISNNHIHHLDYTGISVGWVWGYGESSTYRNIIRGNHIHHVGTGRLSDMGGIYLLGKQKGTVVSENRIHDITSANYGGWGIYTDEGSSYITVENNVVYDTKDTSFHQHYGSQNIVRNNIFAFGNGAIQITRNEPHDMISFENNIYLTDGVPIYHQTEAIEFAGSANNVIWDVGGSVQMVEDVSLETWQSSKGKETGSIAADPLFENATEHDFRLKADSPAISLGFKPIDGFLANGKEDK